MKKLICALIFLSSNLFAQSGSSQGQSQDQQFQKQIEEVMRAREEMLKSLLDDSSSGEMEKRMLEMMKRFSAPGLGMDELEGPVVGSYDWVVTSSQKILKIKVKQIKDHPLDIKIEKGIIKIKGDVESTKGTGKNKVVSKSSFERSFTLPDDVDQTTPEFENKEGEFLIKFKRLKTASKPSPRDRQPVAPSSDDLSI